jgi:O-antigen/teichoic acid export membrane protein
MTEGKSSENDAILRAHDERILRGGLLNAATLLSLSTIGVRIVVLGSTAILARVLHPADYGVVALATTVIGLLDVITNLQVSGSLIRSQQVDRDKLCSAFTINSLRGLFAAIVIFTLANQFASLLGDFRVAPILRVLSLVPLFGGLQNPVFILYERKLQFLPEITRLFLANIAGALASISVAFAYHSYWALVLSTLIIAFVQLLVTYWRVPIVVGVSFSAFKEMFGFGGWLALVSIVEYFNAKMDVLLVGRGLGAALLGQYQAGGQIVGAATGDIVTPLVRAIFPSLALSNGPAELREKYIRIQPVILSLALPMGMGLSALAPESVFLILGHGWPQAIPVVRVVGPLLALQTMLATVDAVAMATGQTRKLFQRTMTVIVVRAGFLLLGYYLGGYMGLIYARVFSATFYLIYGLQLASRLTRTPLLGPIVNSWRSLAAASFMYLILQLGEFRFPSDTEVGVELITVFATRIALGAVTYLGAHYLLWSFSGRPEGAETVLIGRIKSLVKRPR